MTGTGNGTDDVDGDDARKRKADLIDAVAEAIGEAGDKGMTRVEAVGTLQGLTDKLRWESIKAIERETEGEAGERSLSTLDVGRRVSVETHDGEEGIGVIEAVLPVPSDELVLYTARVATPRDPRQISTMVAPTLYEYRDEDHDPSERAVAVRGESWEGDEVFLFPESAVEVIR